MLQWRLFEEFAILIASFLCFILASERKGWRRILRASDEFCKEFNSTARGPAKMELKSFLIFFNKVPRRRKVSAAPTWVVGLSLVPNPAILKDFQRRIWGGPFSRPNIREEANGITWLVPTSAAYFRSFRSWQFDSSGETDCGSGWTFKYTGTSSIRGYWESNTIFSLFFFFFFFWKSEDFLFLLLQKNITK